MTGPGKGHGKQHEQPFDALSVLIEALNERFGLNLGEADRLLFEQQAAHLDADDDVRTVALTNDLDQFRTCLGPEIDSGILDRQEQNDALFQAYFDKPEFRHQMREWLTERLFTGIRSA